MESTNDQRPTEFRGPRTETLGTETTNESTRSSPDCNRESEYWSDGELYSPSKELGPVLHRDQITHAQLRAVRNAGAPCRDCSLRSVEGRRGHGLVDLEKHEGNCQTCANLFLQDYQPLSPENLIGKFRPPSRFSLPQPESRTQGVQLEATAYGLREGLGIQGIPLLPNRLEQSPGISSAVPEVQGRKNPNSGMSTLRERITAEAKGALKDSNSSSDDDIFPMDKQEPISQLVSTPEATTLPISKLALTLEVPSTGSTIHPSSPIEVTNRSTLPLLSRGPTAASTNGSLVHIGAMFEEDKCKSVRPIEELVSRFGDITIGDHEPHFQEGSSRPSISISDTSSPPGDQDESTGPCHHPHDSGDTSPLYITSNSPRLGSSPRYQPTSWLATQHGGARSHGSGDESHTGVNPSWLTCPSHTSNASGGGSSDGGRQASSSNGGDAPGLEISQGLLGGPGPYEPRKEFDCPLRKHNPTGNSCTAMQGYENVSRVKDHILRDHNSEKRCENCWREHKEKQKRPRPCKPRMPDRDFFDSSKKQALEQRLSNEQNDEQKWEGLHSILFGPGVPHYDCYFNQELSRLYCPKPVERSVLQRSRRSFDSTLGTSPASTNHNIGTDPIIPASNSYSTFPSFMSSTPLRHKKPRISGQMSLDLPSSPPIMNQDNTSFNSMDGMTLQNQITRLSEVYSHNKEALLDQNTSPMLRQSIVTDIEKMIESLVAASNNSLGQAGSD